jgi:transcription elongation factor GreA
MDRAPMTPEGYKKLLEELKHIKSVDRPQVIRDIEEARAHGDLSENAEYHAAKEKQSMLAARMNMIETQIASSEVIDPKKMTSMDKIVFGATVTLYDMTNDVEVMYQIVGDDESNIMEKKIGISAPISRGLIGKKEGDEAVVKTPKGNKEFEILKIEYK